MTPEEFEKAPQQGFHNEPQYQPPSGNYSLGIIGSIVGALVGAIPWVIAVNLGWFIGWLAFLIGAASVRGYTMAKGPKDYQFACVAVWVSSISVILIMNFVGVLMEIHAAGFELTMYNIKYVFRILAKDTSFYINIAMSVGIGILGLLGIGKQIAVYTYR